MNVVPLSEHVDFTARHSAPRQPLTRSIFPKDAQAVIHRPAPSVTTSARSRAQPWKLRFERRSAPFIEPLMGWTGGDDPLAQVELSFPSADAAIAYARRHGLQYTVQGLPEADCKPVLVADNPDANIRVTSRQRRRRLEWVERTLGPDVFRRDASTGIDPAASYVDPQDVLQDDRLLPERKRDILRRWALDAFQIEMEHSKGKLLDEPSRLQEVIDALLDLDEPHINAASFQYLNRRTG
jgi:hypothetical protein